MSKALKAKTIPDLENPLSPASLDEKNTKHTIPSVYLDRNFEATPPKGTKDANGKKVLPPSRGFAFAEFTHHVQALACLRELNNNPAYSEDYATGGRAAANALRVAKTGLKKKKKKAVVEGDEGNAGDRVKIPRLIVEFTVENKAKAKQQAERRAHQQAHRQKQKFETKEKRELAASLSKAAEERKKAKKLGRGAKQRENKRLRREQGQADLTEEVTLSEKADAQKRKLAESEAETESTKQKSKTLKPPKKKNKRQQEDTEADEQFSKLFDKYKAAFGVSGKKEKGDVSEPRKEAVAGGKRWFE